MKKIIKWYKKKLKDIYLNLKQKSEDLIKLKEKHSNLKTENIRGLKNCFNEIYYLSENLEINKDFIKKIGIFRERINMLTKFQFGDYQIKEIYNEIMKKYTYLKESINIYYILECYTISFGNNFLFRNSVEQNLENFNEIGILLKRVLEILRLEIEYPKLLENRFHPYLHQKVENPISPLSRLDVYSKDEYNKKYQNITGDTIIDIKNIGFRSVSLGVNEKPTVILKEDI